MNGVDFWPEMERRGPDSVIVAGVRVGEGSRVRLWPKSRADIFDLAAEGRARIPIRDRLESLGRRGRVGRAGRRWRLPPGGHA